ncbi:MAG: anti-sigma factor family protein [Phycicoccus sp.]
MSAHPHDELGAWALDALDEADRFVVEAHLATCETCRAESEELRAMSQLLLEVPPEALLDGPPEGGDLLLRRTLDRVGAERERESMWRRTTLGAVAAAAAVALVGGGVVAGRLTDEPPAVAAPPVTVTPTPSTVPGTQVLTASDDVTGAALDAQVVPAKGWVRISVQVSGIPAGQRCRIIVVSRDGSRQEAGSWLVSGAPEGQTIQGSALVDPAQVAAVVVENLAGQTFVTAPRA